MADNSKNKRLGRGLAALIGDVDVLKNNSPEQTGE